MLGMKQPGLWKVVALARGPARKSWGPHYGLYVTGACSLSPQHACLPHAQPRFPSSGCVLWQSFLGPRHVPGRPNGEHRLGKAGHVPHVLPLPSPPPPKAGSPLPGPAGSSRGSPPPQFKSIPRVWSAV